MSKMSKINLDLQEQANKLGFSSVQEALDAGYEADIAKGKLLSRSDQLYEKAYNEYLDHKLAIKARNDGDYQDGDFFVLAQMNDIVEFIASIDDDKQIEHLLSLDEPVEEIYRRWMKYEDHTWDEYRDVMYYMVKGD